MEVKDNIMLLWPTPIGVFYNDNHYAINEVIRLLMSYNPTEIIINTKDVEFTKNEIMKKLNLLIFLKIIRIIIPIQKKEMKILIFMKVITIFINLIIHHMKN